MKIESYASLGVIIAFVAFFAFFFVIAFLPVEFGATQGIHTGVVTAVEYNSNILWPATLVYFKTNAAATQEEVYCVNNPAVKEELTSAAKNQKEVTISYKNDFLMWANECNGGISIIYAVE